MPLRARQLAAPCESGLSGAPVQSRRLTPAAVAEPLIQIRRTYTATVGRVQLTVEGDADGWTARAIERGRVLYSARRCSAAAARAAATEFATFGTAGFVGAICWTESW
ncbi:MAG: hypothetical protein JST11_12165 [Acidobacteria bacterium]|nr:hypothetical protein [Acidobacteriota bacterium]